MLLWTQNHLQDYRSPGANLVMLRAFVCWMNISFEWFSFLIVFAEHYDPEEDEEEVEQASPVLRTTLARCANWPCFFTQIVHPKSDVQRQRLSEAVKNILLFRSLEPVSVVMICDRFPKDLLNSYVWFSRFTDRNGRSYRRHVRTQSKSISANTVVSLLMTHDFVFWLGRGRRNCYKTRRWRRFFLCHIWVSQIGCTLASPWEASGERCIHPLVVVSVQDNAPGSRRGFIEWLHGPNCLPVELFLILTFERFT